MNWAAVPIVLSVYFHGGKAWRQSAAREDVHRPYLDLRLNPLGPHLFHSQMGTGFAYFLAGRYDEACLWAKQALEHHSDFVAALRLLAASSALAGRLPEAQETTRHLLRLNPMLRVSDLKDVYPFRRPKDLASLIDGLRKAGLPE
jgi:tetratricopeptide (TPR) repeat protein